MVSYHRLARRSLTMPTVIRALLWTAVVIAPGGVLLLPLLVLDSRRRQGEAAADTTRGQPRARGVFVPFCTIWIDLSAIAQDPNSAAGFLLRDGTRARLPSQG
jgi:hypothetical protein